MKLDLHTIMTMIGAIDLLCAGMMGLVSLFADNVRGARQWALGLLAMFVVFFVAVNGAPDWQSWKVFVGPPTLGLALGWLYNGIEAFKNQRRHYRIPVALAVTMLVFNVWAILYEQDLRIALIVNSLVFSGMGALCARALIVPAEQPLRTAYRLAAISFGAVSLLALLRAVNLWHMPADLDSFYAQDEFNPVILLLGGVGHMSVALSLVLLITFKLASDLRLQAGLDSLTGLMNRRSFEQESQRLLARAVRNVEPVAVIMIDVDNFKLVNDVYGHQAGDEVLRRLAKLLQTVVRSGDCLARYGGEEFCLILGGTDEAGAALLAERIRLMYADLRVEWRGQILQGTLSAGAADLRSADDEVTTLIDAADQALYRAKYAGRNRVVLASVSTV